MSSLTDVPSKCNRTPQTITSSQPQTSQRDQDIEFDTNNALPSFEGSRVPFEANVPTDTSLIPPSGSDKGKW